MRVEIRRYKCAHRYALVVMHALELKALFEIERQSNFAGDFAGATKGITSFGYGVTAELDSGTYLHRIYIKIQSFFPRETATIFVKL